MAEMKRQRRDSMVQTQRLDDYMTAKQTTWERRLTFRILRDVNNPKSVHGIYPYRGKISAIDARQIIGQLPRKGKLLDPFCGSGTILYEAREHCIDAIGVDNNPIAVIIANGKLERNELVRLKSHLRELLARARSLQSVPKMPESPSRYFHPETAEQIMRMAQLAMTNEMSDYERACFFGSICLAARGCNHYKWSSTNIGKIFLPHWKIDFYSKFCNKIEKHYTFSTSRAQAQIYQFDSRHLSEIIPAKSVDYVFTSPPYFNALDYTSYYTRIVYEIMGYDRAEIRRTLIQSVDKYEEDMKQVFEELEKVTKDDAMIIFVVGDKKVKDQIISGGEFFLKLSKYEPTYVIEREYTGTASKIWDSINKTRRKEHVVVWDKARQLV
jgi:site-specific DNA-adenine methylase